MAALRVPLELRVAISKQCKKVIITFFPTNKMKVLSTFGVIQGCLLSSTLFGLIINHLQEVLAHVEGNRA
jgi:hypothetical protein